MRIIEEGDDCAGQADYKNAMMEQESKLKAAVQAEEEDLTSREMQLGQLLNSRWRWFNDSLKGLQLYEVCPCCRLLPSHLPCSRTSTKRTAPRSLLSSRVISRSRLNWIRSSQNCQRAF